MKSPDGHESALTVAPLDDSDGNLSLAVAWSPHWITRDYSHLPPYWVRLPPSPPGAGPPSAAEGEAPSPSDEEVVGESASTRKRSEDSARQQGEASADRAITCQVSAEGIVAALTQEEQLRSSPRLDSLYIDHLRVRMGGASDGVWFASAITAFGTTSQTVLWNYRVPDGILVFVRKDTVPCGVLVLLGVADEAATPEWATQHGGSNDPGVALDLFARRHREQRAAMEAEQRLPPAQREAAARDRMRRENEQRLQDSKSAGEPRAGWLAETALLTPHGVPVRDKMRADAQQRETRVAEALQSPRWDAKLVAEHSLAWLRRGGHVGEGLGLKEAVGTLLHRMVLDGRFADSVCRLLDLWRAWADLGGMKKTDYQALQASPAAFAQATLLVALIQDASLAFEGTLATDLQECLSMWKKVRLG